MHSHAFETVILESPLELAHSFQNLSCSVCSLITGLDLSFISGPCKFRDRKAIPDYGRNYFSLKAYWHTTDPVSSTYQKISSLDQALTIKNIIIANGIY